MKRVLSSLALLAALASPARAEPAIVRDPAITSGAIRTTDVGEICPAGARHPRHWDRQRADRIITEYGLPTGPHPDFEIDHLIPLGMAELDDVANLWPEPWRTIETLRAAGSSAPVLLVADVLHPVDRLAVEPFLDGDAAHRRGRRRAGRGFRSVIPVTPSYGELCFNTEMRWTAERTAAGLEMRRCREIQEVSASTTKA